MSGLVDTYIAARLLFSERETALRALINRAAAIALQCQEHPERMMFLGTGIGLPWPPGAAAHAVTVGDGDWPEARRLQQALADWHAARFAAREAWEALPHAFKTAGLPPPPPGLRTEVLPE